MGSFIFAIFLILSSPKNVMVLQLYYDVVCFVSHHVLELTPDNIIIRDYKYFCLFDSVGSVSIVNRFLIYFIRY